MNTVLSVYKPQGLTPFQLINELREKKSEYAVATIGYAGRLDPLAHGVVLLMIDDANKNREEHIGLKKTYEFSVLFGFETDSYDYLGLLKKKEYTMPATDLDKRIKEFVKAHTGTIMQTYPPFSSKTIQGKTLFKLAKKKKLESTDLPTRQVTIDTFDFLKMETVSSDELQKIMVKNLRKIKGFFRQTTIIEQWKKYFESDPNKSYQLARFSITCSTGTYVRSLAQEMGQEFGCGAIAFEILRTQVGEYTIDKSLRL